MHHPPPPDKQVELELDPETHLVDSLVAVNPAALGRSPLGVTNEVLGKCFLFMGGFSPSLQGQKRPEISTPQKLNMTMETQPFEDVSPVSLSMSVFGRFFFWAAKAFHQLQEDSTNL